MRRLFDMENPFMRAMAVAWDLLALNLLTLVCCLPVITAGAAVTAMHDIVIRIVRQEEAYIVRPFFRSFAANLKKATLLWLLILLAAALLYVDYLAALATVPVLRVGVAAIAVLVLAVSQYAFALLARYENTLRGTLKNAAVLMVSYFPRTLCMAAAAVGLWLLAIRYYRIGAPLLLLFGLSMPCYIDALLLDEVFKKLEPEAEPPAEPSSERPVNESEHFPEDDPA